MPTGEMYDPETGREKSSDRFCNFLFSHGALLVVFFPAAGLVSFVTFGFIFGFHSYIAPALTAITTGALCVFLIRKMRSHPKRQDEFAGQDRPRKNLAKYGPDTLSEEEIDKRIRRINNPGLFRRFFRRARRRKK